MKNRKNRMEELTLEEKARLVNGATFFCMAGIERLNIPQMQLLDGGTGINFEQLFRSEDNVDTKGTNGMLAKSDVMHVIEYYYEPEKLNEEEKKLYVQIRETLNTRVANSIDKKIDNCELAPGCFPPGMLLGATWNKDTVKEVGEALGREARAFGINVLLGTPNVNIHRDPLNGRLFEGYSEDPYLVSALAPELVKGVQSYGVAANVKHFAANNQETNRQGINEIISERALHEIYFPGFEACVKEGKAATIMSAYNLINGTACTENEWLLHTILREFWGFEGIVVSDWGAVYHPVEAFKAGNDLKMPGPSSWKPIAQAVQDGIISEEELDKAVERILNLIEKYGTPEPLEEDIPTIVQLSDQAAYNAAVQGIVLLKNENLIFPIKKGRKVVLAGSGAKKIMDCGTGSAGITTNRTTSLYENLRMELGKDCVVIDENLENVNFEDVNLENVNLEDVNTVLLEDVNTGLQDDVDTVLCIISICGMEGNDRTDMLITEVDAKCMNKLIALKSQKPDLKIGVILNTCGPVEIEKWEPDVDGIFNLFLPGMEGGHAMSDLLTGKKNPSGKLPFTFPKIDTPTFLNFPGDGYQVYYGEGIYVGYRYYDKKEVEPLYPFGYGLSYSNFEFSNMRTNCGKMEMGVPAFSEEIFIWVEVENKGPYAGAEVIQLYISDPYTTLHKPVRECKDFQKVYLENGEKRTISFTITKEKLKAYDADLKKWTVEEGYYDIAIGNSSRNLPCSIRVYLDTLSEYSFGENSTVKVLYENDKTREELQKLWNKNHWDWGLVLDKYQYEPNCLIKVIINEGVSSKVMINESANSNVVGVSEFYKEIYRIKRL